MPSRKDAATELAEKMIHVLETQRRLGPASYPLTVGRLAGLADSQALPEQVQKAIAKKPFQDRVAVAKKKSLEAPVALREDIDQLAASPLLLEFALDALCSPATPTASVSKLKTRVDARLKQPFEAAVHRQIQEHTLPAAVECIQVGRTKHLHPLRWPLPREPAEILAESMIQVLAAQRGLGEGSYPLPFDRLLELIDPRPMPALVKKARATETFKKGVLPAEAKKPDAPVALAEDRELLAGSPAVLEFTLKAARRKNKHTFPVDALKKKIAADLRPSFEEAVNRQADTDALPPSVGWIWAGKRHLFLLSDVHRGKQAAAAPRPAPKPPPPAEPQGDFAAAFDRAFQQLDRRAGAHNFVSLVDLRRAVPVPHATFDAGLRQLRQAGRYSLSAAEGRHGLHPDQREAGIMEDGTLLLYVSRKAP
jgi:hypothetical protein